MSTTTLLERPELPKGAILAAVHGFIQEVYPSGDASDLCRRLEVLDWTTFLAYDLKLSTLSEAWGRYDAMVPWAGQGEGLVAPDRQGARRLPPPDGFHTKTYRFPHFGAGNEERCPRCDGAGQAACYRCGGDGEVGIGESGRTCTGCMGGRRVSCDVCGAVGSVYSYPVDEARFEARHRGILWGRPLPRELERVLARQPVDEVLEAERPLGIELDPLDPGLREVLEEQNRRYQHQGVIVRQRLEVRSLLTTEVRYRLLSQGGQPAEREQVLWLYDSRPAVLAPALRPGGALGSLAVLLVVVGLAVVGTILLRDLMW